MHPGRSQDPDYKGTSKRELVLKGESYLNSRNPKGEVPEKKEL